ncbi:MAG: DNRLRE domain-containing protein [Methyloversatilis sp.]|uniref:DNRLRE domain-containing protein n=1 Tax=Methyloversatilis sp. TaxID=2569862 RepID=UPI002732AC48|nr:DNRLRE domain-containing protein [Methyloversatilis sp.]MDP3872016.1 DNRLRE domain-containing protein [Methyloversatilis sp.]
MKFTLIAVALSAALASPAFAATSTTLTFQQGVGGYTGTQDTVIRSNLTAGGGDSTNTNYGDAEEISVDGDDGSPGAKPNQGLIRFDNLFGNSAGQIRATDTIVSATLSIYITNPGSGMTVHDMLVDWAQGSATWNSLVNGVQTDGSDASTTVLAAFGANNGAENVGADDWLTIDLTASLQAMQSGSVPGYGWALMPYAAGSNGIDFLTSEYGAPLARPVLSVEVMPVPEPGTYAMLLAGLGLIGFAARRRG